MAMSFLQLLWFVQVHLLLTAPASVSSWRTSGTLPQDDHFAAYVGKFCFDFTDTPPAGVFNISVHRTGLTNGSVVTSSSQSDELYLVIFDDQDKHWGKARPQWESLSCDERFEIASEVFSVTLKDGRFKALIRINEKIRPRWWYFSLVACGRPASDQLAYSIHAQNPNQGYEQEFSMDELGTVSLHTRTTILFVFVFLSILTSARLNFGPGFLRVRPLLQVLLGILACSAASGLFLLIHFRVYAHNGLGINFFSMLGDLSAAMAKIQLSLLQLFLARGNDFLKAPEEFTSRRATVAFIIVFILTSVGCELYGQFFGDLNWSTSLYFYSSWPGTIVLLMNALLFFEVARSTMELFKDDSLSKELRQFYQRTSASALLYFMVLPVMVLLAQNLAPWVRKKYVQRAEVISRFIACVMLAVCLWPSRLDVVINARLQSSDTRDLAVEMAQNFRVRSESSECPEAQRH